MKKLNGIFILMLLTLASIGKSVSNDTLYLENKITLKTETGSIFGTLTTPKNMDKMPVALIIAGSGPTDRDGNNPMMTNNSLKFLAYELAKMGIASVRYDKRGIAESKDAGKKEKNLRFDDYVNDAKQWIDLLKKDARFTTVTVIGHSEGSLIGMIAATASDKYVSLAGAGQSADKLIKAQLSTQPQAVIDMTFPIIDSLKNGKTVDQVDKNLYALFRPSVQPYMISWFKYDPQVEIQKLTIPVLIVQGKNDIQVSVEDAKRLSKANPSAQMVLIEKMNHIFKIVENDYKANISSYSDDKLPVSEELVKSVGEFILKK